jgi:hypothetical protein
MKFTGDNWPLSESEALKEAYIVNNIVTSEILKKLYLVPTGTFIGVEDFSRDPRQTAAA